MSISLALSVLPLRVLRELQVSRDLVDRGRAVPLRSPFAGEKAE